jgi:fructokinase
MSTGRLCIFGEVLFDHFPDGQRVLGGAPFNVAWHLHAFGQRPHFISRVGDDAEGGEIRSAMVEWGMDLSGVGTDPGLPTGRVEVRFDDGEPSYDIVCPSAYDAIEAELPAGNCRLIYHGSLALRELRSRDTLQALRSRTAGTVFVDVNLRPPWWQREALQTMLRGAHWVKLNAQELAKLRDVGPDAADTAAAFLATYGLRGLIVTHGSAGAEIWTADGGCISAAPKGDIEVVDTVGAGDAFASVIILGIASDWPLEATLQRAQAFASGVVGRRGATVSDRDFYQTFIDAWNLDRK